MLNWPIWQRAAILCTPALAAGLLMDSFVGKALALVAIGLFFLGMMLMAGLHAFDLICTGKPLSGVRPVLIYLAFFTGYGVLSASIGHWFVNYRFSSLCQWFQTEIRKLPPQPSPASLTALTSGHRLIFMRLEVTVLRNEHSGTTIRIEDPREFLSPAIYVNAREIRYADEW